jgi:hypothetical protein
VAVKVDIHWDEQRWKHKRHPHRSGSSNPHCFAKPFESNPPEVVQYGRICCAGGTLGNERRNQVSGLPQRALNFLVFKTFPIRESMSLQLRAEMIFRIANLFGQWHTSLTRTL